MIRKIWIGTRGFPVLFLARVSCRGFAGRGGVKSDFCHDRGLFTNTITQRSQSAVDDVEIRDGFERVPTRTTK